MDGILFSYFLSIAEHSKNHYGKLVTPCQLFFNNLVLFYFTAKVLTFIEPCKFFDDYFC